MLTSLILHLHTASRAELPASLGRAGQALFLRLLAERTAHLATDLHEATGPKPFTVSNLVMGRRQQGTLHLQAGEKGWLRFTGLTAAVSEQLQFLAATPPETIELAGHPFRVSGATLDGAAHPWAGQMSYQALAGPFLLGGQSRPEAKVRLEFVSPTTFKSKGRYVPLPLPELVFGSLLDRWQAFAPIALHPEVRRFAAETVVLSRYELRTRGMPYKQGRERETEKLGDRENQKQMPEKIVNPKSKIVNRGGMQIGFTGQVTFAALHQDRYWLNVLQLLAAFAFYSGVGAMTGAGMGQVRGF